MKKCIIITTYIEGDLSQLIAPHLPAFIICADGGFDHAKKAGITPDLLMGDFDSLKETLPQEIEKITFPSEKDDTDTGLCLKKALDLGYKDILILGGLGGRFDHALSNIQSMASLAPKTDRIAIADRRNYCTILCNEERTLSGDPGNYLSVISLSDTSSGVCISGVKYPLSEHTLTNTFPLGVSNEFKETNAVIRVKNGTLLVAVTKD